MITPVLLCGGSGTRLWPLSRKSYPKQFAHLLGDQTLFQASASRLSGARYNAPVVITASDFRFVVAEQLMAAGIDPSIILLEPEGRNTAPAVLAAALHVAQDDPDALMLVSPSDHAIRDTEAFAAAVAAGVPIAREGRLVTFGITPTYAETGYGYLELHEPPQGEAPVPLSCFVEKPDLARAEEMLADKRYLWNSGIFLFRARDILAAFEANAPHLMTPVRDALEAATPDLGFLRLAPEPWSDAENISLDFAVMERAGNLSVVPFPHGWSDLGGWDAVWRESPRDETGVALSGDATALDCENTLLRSEDDQLSLVGIGLRDIIAVAMPDAVLVAHASQAQRVKDAVGALSSANTRQATEFPKDHRPWGWFESLAIGERFQVKRIQVKPGAALSLQSHRHRSEHWVVVQGTAKVTIEDTEHLVTENQSVYVPLGATHRLENPGILPVVLIEIQTGAYLGEDDIIRYKDIYERSEGE